MTPADLLVASMAAELFSSYNQALVQIESGIYHAAVASQCDTRRMLYRLSYAGSASLNEIMTIQRSTGRVSALVHAGIHPPGRHPPPGQTPPPRADTPLPQGRPHLPPRQTATAADGTHPTGMHSCF